MEDLTVFKAWTMTTDKTNNNAELRAMQLLTGARVGYIYVLPKTLMTLWTPFLLSEEPLLWLGLASMAVSWASSFLLQIPLQLKIKKTGDRVALEKLASTTKIRTFSMIFHTAVVGWILYNKI